MTHSILLRLPRPRNWSPKARRLSVLGATTATAAALVTAHATAPSAASVTDVSLTALKPVSQSNGLGPVEVNRSVGTAEAGDGGVLTVNGRTFSQGLGVHANSAVSYDLGRAYSSFTTQVGVDDEVGRRGSVRYSIIADGKKLWSSPILTGRDAAQQVTVPVAGVSRLTLAVDGANKSTSSDHADWGNPILRPAASSGGTSTTSTSTSPSTTTSSPSTSTSSPTSTSSSSSTTSATSTTTTSATTSPTSTTTTSTSATSSSTTAPSATSTTSTSTTSTGYPGAGNTGVPSGVTLSPSGSLTITTPGTVVDAKDIRGTVVIRANNVTLKRSKVTASAYHAILVEDGVTGVRVEDVEVNGLGKSGTSGSDAIYGPATIVRANIYGVENGIQPSSGSVIQDSWIHNLSAPGDPHYDGIQIDGGRSNITIKHNTVDMREWTQTATVMIDNYFGPASNITVDRNRLLGGGYTVYSDGRFDGGAITNVAFTNNRIGYGHWGYASIDESDPVWSGNVDDQTGATINP